jgi:hypothetical protein
VVVMSGVSAAGVALAVCLVGVGTAATVDVGSMGAGRPELGPRHATIRPASTATSAAMTPIAMVRLGGRRIE